MRLIGAKGLALAAACLPFSAAAWAKPNADDVIKIDITASVAQRCGIAAIGDRSHSRGRIDRAESIAFEFSLDCNTPFRIGVSAQNGALRLASAGAADRDAAGFALAKSYTAGLSFMTDQDGLVDAGDCASNELSAAEPVCDFYAAQPGAGFSPGRRTTAIGRQGVLQIQWPGEDAEAVRHAAGQYQEVLTIVVGPRT